jgi:hypothetical protein
VPESYRFHREYPDLGWPGFAVIAVDTETEMFVPPRYDLARKTRLSPINTPKLVLGSIAGRHGVAVHRGPELVEDLAFLLRDGYHVVFHNVAFDFFVLCQADAELAAELHRAVNENRVHDTMLLEQLIQIARGDQTADAKVIKAPKLVDLAKRRAGMDLFKDDAIRLDFGQFLDPAVPIPPAYFEYAAADAEATYRVFLSQWNEAGFYVDPGEHCPYPCFPDREARFGRLTEAIQVKGALGLRWLENHPLRVDLAAVSEMQARMKTEAGAIEDCLVAWKWARRGPKSGKFSLGNKVLRGVLKSWAAVKGLTPPLSTTGQLSLQYDYWAEHLPKVGADLLANPALATGLEPRLSVWLRYCRLRKLLSTYLNVYSKGPEHYPTYYTLGARTTRVSCVRPNATNIPKRRDGIRALFIPSPGRVLIEADYRAAELVGLAQVFHLLYGGSLLGDAINDGEDPHIRRAKQIVGDGWDTLPESEQKKARQAAKAVNFGVPGGLGAAKFQQYAHRSYGLNWSLDEARAVRAKALAEDDALRNYLHDTRSPEALLRLAAANIGTTFANLIASLKAWRDEDAGTVHWRLAMKRLRGWANGDTRFEVPTRPGFKPAFDLFRTTSIAPCGVVRGRSSYTEGHNLPFQATVACGAKLALWNLYEIHQAGGSTWSPVAFVHDSVLVECEPADAPQVTLLLKDAMRRGLQAVCPDMRVEVDATGPLERWGQNTDAFGAAVKAA